MYSLVSQSCIFLQACIFLQSFITVFYLPIILYPLHPKFQCIYVGPTCIIVYICWFTLYSSVYMLVQPVSQCIYLLVHPVSQCIYVGPTCILVYIYVGPPCILVFICWSNLYPSVYMLVHPVSQCIYILYPSVYF